MKRLSLAAVIVPVSALFMLAMPMAYSIVFNDGALNASQLETVADRIYQIFRPAQPARPQVKVSGAPALDQLLFQLPLPGERMTSVFGYRIHPIFRRRIFHEGLDFHARLREPVHCVLDGVVRFAGRRGGFGRAVCVYHPVCGKTTLYAHLSRIAVHVGQPIQQGELVGLAGSTGLSTGPHLHFGVKSEDGKWLNPSVFLTRVAAWEAASLKTKGLAVYSAYLAGRRREAMVHAQPAPPAVLANHHATATAAGARGATANGVPQPVACRKLVPGKLWDSVASQPRVCWRLAMACNPGAVAVPPGSEQSHLRSLLSPD